MAVTIERKYALTKVAAGHYLLPSNDGKTLWRLLRYEDGPSHGIVDWDKDEMFWGVWRYTLAFDGTLEPDQLDAWTFWEQIAQTSTRREAIDAAMEYEDD